MAGGTGFVGSAMVGHLAACGHRVTCLVRTPRGEAPRAGVSQAVGDVFSPGLADMMRGADAVINLIGIIRDFPRRGITFEKLHVEATERMVDAARRAGVRRFLQMSANGVRPDGISRYQRTKYAAEELVRGSGLEWTIFRPSLIFGEPPEGKTEFCTQLAKNFKNVPVVPMFGDGNYRFQPIHVSDVAGCFEKALGTPAVIGKTLHLGGDVTCSYREILNMIFLGMGKKPPLKIPVPWFLARPAVELLGNFDFFPATAEQITMLLEGNTVPETEFKKLFNISPIPFSVANLAYLNRNL